MAGALRGALSRPPAPRRASSPPGPPGLGPAAALLAGLAAWACWVPAISPYSPVAYRLATDLKVESLALMRRATEPFEEHRAAVEELREDLAKAYEFARGRPRNELSARQWEILVDPGGRLLGGFLARWEREGELSALFVEEMRRVVSDAFDTIIGLESGKVRPDEVREG